ncbi:hypothetical protein CRG98_039107 [Punica granatum]|uniref:Aluminum-activated malate transporter 10-like n=1 Tax=Punica granatum TaxID=22663 RepID=A0A2I0I912_PUNGR|nr:hypothetical protein CRG98_039107 [Punica granatum]
MSGKLQWRIDNVAEGTSKALVPEPPRLISRVWAGIKCVLLLGWAILAAAKFLERAWKMGVAEPKKLIHGLKVGMALSMVSLFYYMRPLYEGVGGNAMWAVMTVVVVFEYTVGATLSKSINRATGTFLAGSLGVGVHWAASQSGNVLEPIIVGISVFLLASAATFSRFIPTVKARFDYGALIFILTFSLVSVSGYRVEKLVEMAHQRLSTVVIGTSLCIITSILVCPIWAGLVADYFKSGHYGDDSKEDNPSKNIQAYKCVLNSKANEESMANFARWEPAHGRFSFRHPWKEYLKIGALMRNCAHCIETLTGCIEPEVQEPEHLKRHLHNACMTLCRHSSNVLKELALMMETMTKYSELDLSAGEMSFAVQELQEALRSLPTHPQLMLIPTDGNHRKLGSKVGGHGPRLLDVLPLVTVVSLLIETAARIEDLADGVVELSKKADFKIQKEKKPNQDQKSDNHVIEFPDQYKTVKGPSSSD